MKLERASGVVPFAGHLLRAHREGLSFYRSLRDRHGDFVRFRLGPYPIHLLSDPEGANDVFRRDVTGYRKGFGNDVLRPLIGRGLFFAEGDDWRAQRRLVQTALQQKNLAELSPIIEALTAEMLERWSERARTREPIAIDAELRQLLLSIAGVGLLGSELFHRSASLRADLDALWMATNAQLFLQAPVLRSLPLPAHRRFRELHERIRRALEAMLTGARELGPERAPSIIQQILALDRERSDGHLDEGQILDNMLTIAFAGQECTAIAISWALAELADAPEIRERLASEVDAAPALEPACLALTRAVIDETLRLHPPAWMVARQANEPQQIGACPFGKDEILFISPYVIQRHPDHWTSPDTFDPDRARARHAYLPFATGPRTCVGMNLALLQAIAVLARIVRRFDLSHARGSRPVPVPGLSLRSKAPMMMRASPRRT
jgi:cytochrome P450